MHRVVYRKYYLMPDRYDELVRRTIMHPDYVPVTSRRGEANDDLTIVEHSDDVIDRLGLGTNTGVMTRNLAKQMRKEGGPAFQALQRGTSDVLIRNKFREGDWGNQFTPPQLPTERQLPDRYLSSDKRRGTYGLGFSGLERLNRLGVRQKQFYL